MTDFNIINILVDKTNKQGDYDVFEKAWTALIQRFENTLSHRNFRGPANADERGMIFPDFGDTKKLTQLLRKMRHWNPVPNQQQFGAEFRNLTINSIIEDPNFRNSEHSYFIQSADVVAYLLFQHIFPNSYMRRKAGYNYFTRLLPALCTIASSTDPLGIVRL